MQRSKMEIAKDIEATGLEFAPLMQRMSELLAELEESMGWLDGVDGAKQEAAEFTANVGGEVSEWWEHWRNGVLDLRALLGGGLHRHQIVVNDQALFEQSKKGKAAGVLLTNEEEEVADIVIRAMAYAGRRVRTSPMTTARALACGECKIGEAIVIKSLINASRERRHGGKQA